MQRVDNELHQVCPMFDLARTGLINLCFGGYGSVTPGSWALCYLEEYNLFGDPSISTLTYCPINISLQNKQIENNQSNSYLADNNINISDGPTTFKAKNGSDIALYAGNNISINGVFEIELGAKLTIDNKICEPSGLSKSAEVLNSEFPDKTNQLNSINSENELLINIIPNPNSGYFRIIKNYNAKINSIEILDISGKLLYKLFSDQNEVFIDISDQPDGMHLIKLHLENQVIVKEIVKE